jgi:hypothetical protein
MATTYVKVDTGFMYELPISLAEEGALALGSGAG